MTLAVIPAGYADGLDRRLEDHGFVLIRGRRAKIVGAVSMDMLTVDVTDIGDVGPGDEVVFLGSQGSEPQQTIDASEMADWIDTIPYEILCRLGSRVERRYESDSDTEARRSRKHEIDLTMRQWLYLGDLQCFVVLRGNVVSAMKQAKPVFVCQECGAQQPKWQGRCPDCGAWNSFVEERAARIRRSRRPDHASLCDAGTGGARRQEVLRDRSVEGRSHHAPASASSIACSAAASFPAR